MFYFGTMQDKSAMKNSIDPVELDLFLENVAIKESLPVNCN